MVKLAIKMIIYSVAMLSAWLESRDDDDTGADDAIAAALDVFGKLLEEYEDNGVSKKVIMLALELVQTLLERLDDDWEGIDDVLAEKIGKLKGLLE